MSDGIAVASVDATEWIAVVTDKGNALLAKLAEGSTLEITRAVSGSGTVDTTLLAQQTAVDTPQQTVTFQPVAYPGEKMCKLPITIRNNGLATSYICTNIGVFANDPDEGEILFFKAAAVGPGTSIASENLQPGYSADFFFYVGFGNADGVSVTIDPSNSVTQEGLENHVATELAKLTPDNEKHVAYAQRAGTADKTQSSLTIRVNGGRIEGSNQWTFDGSTGRTINITPDKIGAAPAVESTEYPGCYYRTVGGSTEWINPPMVSGKEYRTTERMNGSPVYATMYTGYLAVGGSRDIILTNLGQLIDYSIKVGVTGADYSTMGVTHTVNASNTKEVVCTISLSSNASKSLTITAVYKYTKE